MIVSAITPPVNVIFSLLTSLGWGNLAIRYHLFLDRVDTSDVFGGYFVTVINGRPFMIVSDPIRVFVR